MHSILLLVHVILRVPSADSIECDAFYIAYHIKQF